MKKSVIIIFIVNSGYNINMCISFRKFCKREQ